MTFPDDALNARVELKLGSTWTDITGHVYTRDPITITRGRQDEGARSDPAKCTMTLNNRDGRYSPRNVTGPYYGLIGRNTPIRVSAGTGTPLLYLPGGGNGGASTPDHASLDITGDIDIRVDAALQWRSGGGGLAGKYVEPSQKSWILWLTTDGKLTLYWSVGGPDLSAATSTAAVPVETGRLAVRATLDVNNGAGGKTFTFYTAPTNAGPWTQLGAPVVQAGTTSIFNSTSPLVVANSFSPVPGRYYAAEIRNGIGGTVVANPIFTAQAESATSFADGAGRTWTVNGEALLTNRVYRFHGEVPAWPPRWGPSEQDGYVSIEAAGVTRRLGQGRKPIQSALRRALNGIATPFAAWWPLEEQQGATRGASGYAGAAPMLLSGDAEFTGSPSGGVGGGVTIGQDGRTSAGVTGCPALWMIAFCLDVPAGIDASTATPMVQWRIPTGNPIVQFDLYTAGGFNGQMLLEASDAAGNIVFSTPAGMDVRGQGPLLITVCWRITPTLIPVVDMDINGTGLIFNRTGDTTGPITSVGLNMLTVVTDTSYSGGTVSHLLVTGSDRQAEVQSYRPAASGYVGETAGNRFQRLCDEESLAAAVVGDPDVSEAMGPQMPAPILELLGDCEDADGGTMYEAADEFALRYRPRSADYNTPTALSLDYKTQVAAPLEPVDDDQGTRNDVTVERSGGSSARVVIEDGPLSTQAPPDGVGVYDESLTVNVAADSQLLPIAGWKAHLGTVDEARYPVVRLKLHKHPDLIDAVAAMDLRARVHLSDLPAWEPPGIVDLLAEGYTETLEPRRWIIEYNTVPGSPWRTAVVGDPVLGRVDTDGSSLASSATSGATTLSVATTSGPLWTVDPLDFPFDVTVGGEVMTVVDAAGAVTDTFTRSVSNGWGTATTGQTWSTSGGSASDYSVTGSVGRVSCTTTVDRRFAALGSGIGNATVAVKITTPVLAATQPITGGLVARWTDVDNLYLLQLSFNPSGTATIELYKRVTSTFTLLANAIDAITYTPGVPVWLRAWCVGSALKGRAWNADRVEPDTWAVAAVDATFSSGAVGTKTSLASGNTNTLPVAVDYDDLTVTRPGITGASSPQTFKVVRSINGIVKAQPAGADVRLAQPSIIAL